MTRRQKNDATLALGDAVSRSHTTKGEYTPADLIAGSGDPLKASTNRRRAEAYLWGTDVVGDILARQGWTVEQRETEHHTYRRYLLDPTGRTLATLTGKGPDDPKNAGVFAFTDTAPYVRGDGTTGTFENGDNIDAARLFTATTPGVTLDHVVNMAIKGADELDEKAEGNSIDRDAKKALRDKDVKTRASALELERLERDLDVGNGPLSDEERAGLVAAGLAVMEDVSAEVEEPTLMHRDDGKALLYPGKIHTFYGEAESAKTMAAQAEIKHQIEAGNHVWVLDYEDGANSWKSRLTSMDVDEDTINRFVHYFAHIGSDMTDLRRNLAFMARVWTPAVVVVDGVTAALSQYGLSEDDNRDVSLFYGPILDRQIAQQYGAAVIAIDHVTKAVDGRRHARGASAKLDAITGAGYLFTPKVVPQPGGKGEIEIYVTKDRPGGVRQHSEKAGAGRMALAAVMVANSTPLTLPRRAGDVGPLRVSFEAPDTSTTSHPSDGSKGLALSNVDMTIADMEREADENNGTRITHAEVATAIVYVLGEEGGLTLHDLKRYWKDLTAAKHPDRPAKIRDAANTAVKKGWIDHPTARGTKTYQPGGVDLTANTKRLIKAVKAAVSDTGEGTEEGTGDDTPGGDDGPVE